MLMVKIYGIVNPVTDDVLYIGASRNPKLRYYTHSKGRTWVDKGHTHRQQQILKMKNEGILPELLILDEVDFPGAQFFEEFYMQLFKSWGYKIEQQTWSGYQTNKTSFKDNERVFVKGFNMYGNVIKHDVEMEVHVFLPDIKRVFRFYPSDLKRLSE